MNKRSFLASMIGLLALGGAATALATISGGARAVADCGSCCCSSAECCSGGCCTDGACSCDACGCDCCGAAAAACCGSCEM